MPEDHRNSYPLGDIPLNGSKPKDDFTFYVTGEAEIAELLRLTGYRPDHGDKLFQFDTSFPIDAGTWYLPHPRIQMCWCAEGSALSVTVRHDNPVRKGVDAGDPPEFGFAPSEDDTRPGNPISVKKICTLLTSHLRINNETNHAGLILVTGETGSLKSQISRGLLFEYLNGRTQRRTPHLITWENPIEKYYFGGTNGATFKETFSARMADERRPIDYTPRDGQFDCPKLDQFFAAALRQKPAAAYIGEIRDDDDLTSLIDFAGTGHFVLATAHASSLAESMARLISAYGAVTPAGRATIANRILALIHCRKFSLAGGYEIVVPSFWRPTGGGKQSLISDGLSAISPSNPRDEDIDKTACFGRYWCADKLGVPDTCRDELMTQTLKEDLLG